MTAAGQLLATAARQLLAGAALASRETPGLRDGGACGTGRRGGSGMVVRQVLGAGAAPLHGTVAGASRAGGRSGTSSEALAGEQDFGR